MACVLIANATATVLSPNPEAYFYAPVGSTWHYQGMSHDREVQLTSPNTFMNIATAVKTTKKHGQHVIVIVETNAGNAGVTESYYHIGNDGVMYHGSEPQQLFEQHLVPYPVVRFPLFKQQLFRQFDVNDRNFFQDLDGDGVNERVDAHADVTVGALETISVPAGTFGNVLRLNGNMAMTITMSSSGDVVVTNDRLTSWFAPHIGLIKYVETIEIPMMGGTIMRTIVVTEALEAFRIAGPILGFHIVPFSESRLNDIRIPWSKWLQNKWKSVSHTEMDGRMSIAACLVPNAEFFRKTYC